MRFRFMHGLQTAMPPHSPAWRSGAETRRLKPPHRAAGRTADEAVRGPAAGPGWPGAARDHPARVRPRPRPAAPSAGCAAGSWLAPGHLQGRVDHRREHRRVGRRDMVLDAPQVPVVHHRAGQQDADAATQRTQHREPPGPAVDGLHRRVEAHGPAPEERRAFAGRAAVGDLLDLAFATEAADRQDGRAVHREQQRAAVQEGDAEHVEGVVEQVAVAQREGRCPVQVREDAEGHGLAPGTHQQRPDEAQHEVEPNRCGEGPGHVRAHAELAGAPVHAHPPQQDGRGEEEAGQQPPAALVQRWQPQAIARRWRLERQPRQLAHELDRVPAHRGPHVQPDDLDRDEAADQRPHAQPAQVDGPELRVADAAEQMHVGGAAAALVLIPPERHTGVGRSGDLHAREKVLVVGHVAAPYFQTGRLSHQLHHSGQPRVQKGPLMTMQTALQKPAESARNKPRRWMPSVPME
mmetsp:Transcript_53735/g.126556  ORF Transcript_53735/g.126556 Transcript_53735/m.126556 type:complete len:464 (-) Transcript_53735:3682-5073(-)